MCKWMLKLRLSNLICLTTYLRILFLFDNVLLTLSKHKSYQRLYSVNITWKLFLKFLIVTIYHTTNVEKVGFAITFLCMYHAITDCVDSHLLSVICKILVKQALSLTHFLYSVLYQPLRLSKIGSHNSVLVWGILTS